MRFLSLLAFFNFYSFVLIAIYLVKHNCKEKLNRIGAFINLSFAVWTFSATFFYSAPSYESARLWHAVGSIGWIIFVPLTTQFYLVLTDNIPKHGKGRYYFVLYVLSVIMLLRTFLTGETPISNEFVLSTSGLGWTYVTNYRSLWFWLYILQLFLYLSYALFLTYHWAKMSNRSRYKLQSKSIIKLNTLMMIIGIFTDIIIPSMYPILPPLLCILLIIWGAGFIYIIKNYKLMSVDDVATPELILKTVMDPIIMTDKDGIIKKCNQATVTMLKYSNDQIVGKNIWEFYKAKNFSKERWDLLYEQKTLSDIELELVDAFNNVISVMASFSLAESRLDRFVGVVVNFHDITEYKKLYESLERMANYDKLTKLPNRRLFSSKLDEAIDSYFENGVKFALVFMDLDGFKKVNDTCGHDMGDKVLLEISKRMSVPIREIDTFARIGGDEFVMIFTNYKVDIELNNVITSITNALEEPISIEDKTCKVGVSMGISICPEDGITRFELMKKADEKMYANKLEKNKKAH